jgi:flagellar biogenesis protein FliO
MATNLKEDKVMMGFIIAFIIIVLIVLYSLARTAGESDRILENIREQSLLGREDSSGGNS